LQAARRIQAEAWERWHIPVSIGIGSSKLISRLASGQKKPRGLTVVPPGHELSFLLPLPVGKLPGVGRVTEQQLFELGITTIGKLARLNQAVLEQLFGKNGRRLWELANGIDRREVQPVTIPRQLSRETSFEEDVADDTIVLSTVRYLLDRLAQKLRERHLVARRVGVRVRYSGFQTFQKTSTLPHATADAAVLAARAEALFQAMPVRRERFRFVQVQVSECEPAAWQRQLFPFEQKQQKLNGSIDAIRERFGFMAILPAKTLLLQSNYQMDSHGYILHTPSLSQ
jgi:DNA polymerase-4